MDVYENNAKKLDVNTQLVLIYGPLAGYINTKTEQNLVNCACFCLLEFVKYVIQEKNQEILGFFYKEIPQLFVKELLDLRLNLGFLEKKGGVFNRSNKGIFAAIGNRRKPFDF